MDQNARPGQPSPDASPGHPTPEARPSKRWRAALPWPVLAAAGGAAIIAAAVARLVFPVLSINNDEAVYLLQADALAHGSLFPRAPDPLSAFTPWLMAAREGHYLPKYTPLFPALLALSKMLTGGTTAALVLVAGTVPIVTYLLAREVTAERRTAVFAAVLVADSPLIVVHSGLHLTYLPTMVLLEAFAWMLLRGVRTGAGGWLAGAGLALSSAATTRPYDAVLFALPLLAWTLLRRPFRERTRELAWIIVGGLLPAALLVAYNLRATGSPLQLPFSVLEPLDKLGFGLRKLYPTDLPHHFGPREGAMAAAIHLRQMAAWSAGGALTMALAAAALVRRRTQGPLLGLAGAWVTFPLGYFFFWGSWNASVFWTGTKYVGPFYFTPLLPSLAILAALTLVDLTSTRRLAAAALTGVVAVSSLAMTVVVIRANLRTSANDQRLEALLDAPGNRQLIFVGMDTPFLMHPSSVISNDWQAGGRRVFALHNPATDLLVAKRLGGRTLLQLTFEPRRTLDPKVPMNGTLRRLVLVNARTLPLSLHARLPSPARRLLLKVSAAGHTTTFDLGPQNRAEVRLAGLQIGGDGEVSLNGKQPLEVRQEEMRPQTITFQLLGTHGDDTTKVASEEIVAAIGGGEVQALVPGALLGTVGAAEPSRLELFSG